MKQALQGLEIAQPVNSPRSSERGPVEAKNNKNGLILLLTSPRSSERGPVEATPEMLAKLAALALSALLGARPR